MLGLIRALILTGALIATPTVATATMRDAEPLPTISLPLPTLTLPTQWLPGDTGDQPTTTPETTISPTASAPETSKPQPTSTPASKPPASPKPTSRFTQLADAGSRVERPEQKLTEGGKSEQPVRSTGSASPAGLAVRGDSQAASSGLREDRPSKAEAVTRSPAVLIGVGGLLAGLVMAAGARMVFGRRPSIRTVGAVVIGNPQQDKTSPDVHQATDVRKKPGYAAGFLDGWKAKSRDQGNEQDDDSGDDGRHLRSVD